MCKADLKEVEITGGTTGDEEVVGEVMEETEEKGEE